MTQPTQFGVILATAGIQYVIHAKRNIFVLRTAATLLDFRLRGNDGGWVNCK